MSGIFSALIFNPAIFNTGSTVTLTGFIPRGSVAAIAVPDRPTATVTVPVLPKAEVV